MQQHIVIKDSWSRAMAHCTGPDETGACPRVDPGDVVPCAGRVVAPDEPGAWVAFRVPDVEVNCPVTTARAMAATHES